MNIKTGTLIVEKNHVYVSDPCYIGEHQHLVEKVEIENGEYNTFVSVDTKSKRIASLYIILEGYEEEPLTNELECVIGVDSGQAGIFTSELPHVSLQDIQDSCNKEFPYEDWRNEFTDQDSEVDKFYKVCCNHTLSNNEFGNINTIGVVSRSGYGDGAYDVFKLVDEEGFTVGLEIKYI